MVKHRTMNRAILLLLLFTTSVVLAQRAVPPLWGHRVHDEAQVLHPGTVEELDALLKQHEDSTSNQVAVLIISSLEGESIEEYAFRVAEKEWKLGQAKNDNGVLLLFVINDRKVRIEVGQGLEGSLTDLLSNRIIKEKIAPNFREQNYDQGVRAAVGAVLSAIAGEYEAEAAAANTSSNDSATNAIAISVLIGFTFLALFMPGCAAWFLYVFLIPFYGSFGLSLGGDAGGQISAGSFILGFPILRAALVRTPFGKRMKKSFSDFSKSSGAGGGTGWTSRSTGGWSGSSGRSAGGFSGGGGSFGGGGSTGSW